MQSSSVTPRTERVSQDVYNTPLWLATLIVEKLRPHFPRLLPIWEPSVGSGRFLEALGPGYNTIATDIRPDALGLAMPRKSWVLDLATGELPNVGVAMGNLPFGLADQILPRLLPQARLSAYLFRVNYLGGQGRRDFWAQWPVQHLLVSSRRPSFVAVCSTCKATQEEPGRCPCGGHFSAQTDSTEYACFVWTRDRKPLPNLPPIGHL